MDNQFQEYLQNKSEFEAFMQFKRQQAQRRQLQNSTKYEKRSDQCCNSRKVEQKEETDLTYLQKTLEYIQRMESRQSEQDKMIQIYQNQTRMLDVLQGSIDKIYKQQLKRRKNNKTFLCEDCPNPKYFANKYTLRRHKISKHTKDTDNQDLIH